MRKLISMTDFVLEHEALVNPDFLCGATYYNETFNENK